MVEENFFTQIGNYLKKDNKIIFFYVSDYETIGELFEIKKEFYDNFIRSY